MFTNVLFISGIDGDTRRYRCHHHQEQLALHGIRSTLRAADDRQLYVDGLTHDLLILHRVAYSPLIGDLLELAQLRGTPTIFETDDLIFEPELYGAIAFLDTLPPAAAQRFRASLDGQAKTFAHCDFVLTTTQFLADAAAQRGKSALVQRNAYSAEMLRCAENAYQARLAQRAARNEVVIGYFSGTGSHNRDFALITPTLLTLLERYPHVRLHVGGHLELDARFRSYSERIRRSPLVPWQELPNLIAQVDINLAPLELGNRFCQAKSEIKYSEAALVGVPTIASPTEAFVFAIQPGENGLLAATPTEWLAHLEQLIVSPAERQRIGEQARQVVTQRYSPQARSQELLATLNTIQAEFTPATSQPEALAPTVARMLTGQIAALLEQQAQQSRQIEQLRQTLATWQANPAPSDLDSRWQHYAAQVEEQQTAILQDILDRLLRK